MKIRFSLAAPLALVTALVVGACSGGTAVSTGPGVPGAPGSTAAPGATSGPAGSECAPYPTLSLTASAQPSFPVDSTLLSEYPAIVGGQPITGAEAFPMLAYLCYLGGQAAIAGLSQSSVLGINLSTMSFGNFTATIENNEVKVTAIRTAGQDATKLFTSFGLFGGFLGVSNLGTNLTDSNVGGKNVKVSTASDGTKTFFYAHGDTLFYIDNASDAEATAILTALP